MSSVFPDEVSYNRDDAKKIINISSWGPLAFGDTREQFMGAENLVIAAKDIPETSEVTSFSHAFYNCSSLSSVPGMSLWETSQVTSMGFMFNGASAFKGDIAGCDTSKVIDMSWMFNEASVFNQDIGGWNVSNVTDMEAMLSESALSTENYDAILTDCSKRGFFWRGKY